MDAASPVKELQFLHLIRNGLHDHVPVGWELNHCAILFADQLETWVTAVLGLLLAFESEREPNLGGSVPALGRQAVESFDMQKDTRDEDEEDGDEGCHMDYNGNVWFGLSILSTQYIECGLLGRVCCKSVENLCM